MMVDPNELEEKVQAGEGSTLGGVTDVAAGAGGLALDVGIESAIDTGADVAVGAAEGALDVAGGLLGGIFDIF